MPRDPAPNDGRSASENRSERPTPSGGPEPGDRVASSPAAAEPGEPGVEAEERRDDEQDVDRRRGVEERAPLVVATGNSRLVTRNMIRLSQQERPERRGRGPATAARPGR